MRIIEVERLDTLSFCLFNDVFVPLCQIGLISFTKETGRDRQQFAIADFFLFRFNYAFIRNCFIFMFTMIEICN